jgi:hypothetical protein
MEVSWMRSPEKYFKDPDTLVTLMRVIPRSRGDISLECFLLLKEML